MEHMSIRNQKSDFCSGGIASSDSPHSQIPIEKILGLVIYISLIVSILVKYMATNGVDGDGF